MGILDRLFRSTTKPVKTLDTPISGNKTPTSTPTPASTKPASLIFLSGSKVPGISQTEIERFRDICEAVGETLGELGLGIVGCAPHIERLLASQYAKAGLLRKNPDATFSTAGLPDNRLYAEDRIKFVELAAAAIFIGGSSGTIQEYLLCKQRGITPLIPVAGADGAGAKLAKDLQSGTRDFWTGAVSDSIVGILCAPNARPIEYAHAVREILIVHSIVSET